MEAEVADGLPQPSGGKKEYNDAKARSSRSSNGSATSCTCWWTPSTRSSWPIEVTTANSADNKSLPDLVQQGQANLPEGRIETLAYDKAADDGESTSCFTRPTFSPVIQNRHLWKDQTEQMLPGHDGKSNIVYDEAGTVHCYDRTSQPIVRHPMAYIGYEPQRETLKYRCPARHEGWTCPHDEVCNAGKILRQDGAGESDHRPATVPADSAGDQEVRATVQRPHVGGAGERPAEDLLGR